MIGKLLQAINNDNTNLAWALSKDNPFRELKRSFLTNCNLDNGYALATHQCSTASYVPYSRMVIQLIIRWSCLSSMGTIHVCEPRLRNGKNISGTRFNIADKIRGFVLNWSRIKIAEFERARRARRIFRVTIGTSIKMRDSTAVEIIETVTSGECQEEPKCITQHSGFHPVCINRWVLQNAWYQYTNNCTKIHTMALNMNYFDILRTDSWLGGAGEYWAKKSW